MRGPHPANPLAAGFYTVRDAARLIEVGSQARITGWLRGYAGSRIGPLLTRDFLPVDGRQELSFLDLMEVRFVEHFRAQGVSMRALRRALETARQIFANDKPLASDKVVFRVTDDRRNIFVEEAFRPAAKETEDRQLWSLLTRQYEIYDLIVDRLAAGVVFDPDTAMASIWTPRPREFPTITIDPRVAYGHPALPSGVPTRTVFDACAAEDGDVDAVAHWFEIPVDQVRDAVAFETRIDGQIQAAA